MRWIREGRYKPIAAYGIIGDMRTAALVGADGSIDWCCFPRFDSPSVFAAILDHARGGHFAVRPVAPYTSHQRYFPLTNILVTTFHLHDGGGAFELLDFMPAPGETPIADAHEIHRRIRGIRGRVQAEIVFQPRFGYALHEAHLRTRDAGLLAHCEHDTLALGTSAPVDWHIDDTPCARASLAVRPGDDVWMVLQWDGDGAIAVERAACQQELERTAAFWNRWAGRLTFDGVYRAEVERSALALKALFYEPTGAVVAAATASLPESIGGVRNWDYRYCWLRDAAFTLSAFETVGLYDEAERFEAYLEWVAARSDGGLQIMYGIGGETELHEKELPHLEGYRGSRPVRIGNRAHSQLQLDIYGELLAAVYLWHERRPLRAEFRALLVRIVDWLCDHWREPDSGIWEARSEPRHYVFSKVMCWVAFDRAIRMADPDTPAASLARWQAERDAVRADVLERGWSEEKQSFVQSYDSTALDAANLRLSAYGFLPGDDPRMKATIDATLRELTRDGMLYRYRSDDGLPGTEGVFSICTFWLADALILAGDVAAGERVFRRMLRLASPLGLHSEQIDPQSGDLLGNFPQAFTHIALINTATLLEQAWRQQRA